MAPINGIFSINPNTAINAGRGAKKFKHKMFQTRFLQQMRSAQTIIKENYLQELIQI